MNTLIVLSWLIAGYFGGCLWDILPGSPKCSKWDFFTSILAGYMTLSISLLRAVITGIIFIIGLEEWNILRHPSWHTSALEDKIEINLKRNIRKFKWKGKTIFISW